MRVSSNEDKHEKQAFSHVAFPEGLAIAPCRTVGMYMVFEYTGHDIDGKLLLAI
jgi:hypothetical protein